MLIKSLSKKMFIIIGMYIQWCGERQRGKKREVWCKVRLQQNFFIVHGRRQTWESVRGEGWPWWKEGHHYPWKPITIKALRLPNLILATGSFHIQNNTYINNSIKTKILIVHKFTHKYLGVVVNWYTAAKFKVYCSFHCILHALVRFSDRLFCHNIYLKTPDHVYQDVH